jgi:hypothetical protein
VRDYVVTNNAAAAADVSVSLSGDDAQFFEIVDPGSFPVSVAAGETLTVQLQLITNNALLAPAPAQDDGATVFNAQLVATVNGAEAQLRLYALVLTYVELEPTFGQLMGAFPYQVDLGDALQNDANPNPTTLPGVEAGTDEVAAPTFQKADAGAPVVMLPLGRFSPPGLVPYGWYTPGNTAQSTLVATMGEANDAHTNNQSRMINPPLSQGMPEFDPGASPFGVYMEPDGQAIIYSEDAENSDGQHRLKVFVVHDAAGAVIPNTYLLGGEEAANGDYQDYVLLLSNVTIP